MSFNEDNNSKPMGIGQINRAITDMPMGPYWLGLISNSKHVTFRTASYQIFPRAFAAF